VLNRWEVVSFALSRIGFATDSRMLASLPKSNCIPMPKVCRQASFYKADGMSAHLHSVGPEAK
jgi:hypothetical protein